ncbi:MAG: tRNA (N(6)-L-threonylcarbamoyladenosine(37)-C(2))-methylthiotransferase MtaB, partial [Clostridia bacterium]|nr:tRNA (N(6)-L-threonylcarbamoyladenosine(37)-C(2))-methylthiotransferase MtaB [Clostridia bacterium]
MSECTLPRVGLITLGCKVNQYESEAIAELFVQEGFAVGDADDVCDVYVINTCTVTAESDRKAGQLIRRAAAKNPAAPILVTGCFSQSHPARVAAIKGVDFVCGNTDKLAVVQAAKRLLKTRAARAEIAVDDVQCAPFEPMTITRFDRTRAYVKIEDGCENRCSYCAIPAARGRVRSKPLADVVREVEGLVRGGCREVVLTGIETASWGRDLEGVTLADLIVAVDAIEGLERLRLGSLEPTVMREEFLAKIANLRTVVPHFHLSMQSGSARVLAAMRRRYNPDQAMAGIKRLRAAMPNVELTTDFIVGFPGESEEDFADTMRFAAEAEFLQMHVFAYSKREGTP